ncbi:hypothetical protein I3843_11G015400 [Carya illinoinensis]|nr:hypothetical protein I3843_11G015400 [Carya illinoinensis]
MFYQHLLMSESSKFDIFISSFTDQQRDAASREGWSYRLVFSARLVGIFLVADALFFGAQQVGHYLQDLRSH